LKGTQDDSFKPHNHVVNLTTNETGVHYHDIYAFSGGNMTPQLGRSLRTTVEAPPSDNNDAPYGTTNNGAHTHTVNGNTADSGNTTANETRVFSYGVTWIIKI
jgi:hypothetical protein